MCERLLVYDAESLEVLGVGGRGQGVLYSSLQETTWFHSRDEFLPRSFALPSNVLDSPEHAEFECGRAVTDREPNECRPNDRQKDRQKRQANI